MEPTIFFTILILGIALAVVVMYRLAKTQVSGHVLASDSVSLRTLNRSFEDVSGTKDANTCLSSPEAAVAAATAGEIDDQREYADKPEGLEKPAT